jgi:hypothetical protein
MSGQLVAISNATLGFLGLNTQESGVTLESGYATKATNCLIDRYGRLGARKGWNKLTTSATELGSNNLHSLFEFIDTDRERTILSSGNGKFFKGIETLTQVPVKLANETTDDTTTFTGNRWQWASLAEGAGTTASMYGFAAQKNNPFMVYRRAAHSGPYIIQQVGNYGSKPSGVSQFDPDSVLSAFGRIWVAGVSNAKATIYYSRLLDGAQFSGTGSGVLDIAAVVGNNDEIIGLASHNSYLVVFCRNNIVIYRDADDPTIISLQDVITGIGCIGRDTIQQTGTDLIFLSRSGLRSLNRTIQENSAPMRELSINIRDDLVNYIEGEVEDNLKSAYYERDAFYLLTIPSQKQIVYFDLRNMLPNGAARTTIWNNLTHTAFVATQDRRLLLGVNGGVGSYFGYSDNGATYRLEYFTANTDGGQPFNLKLLKKTTVVFIGSGRQDVVIKWGFDYGTVYTSRVYTKDTDLGESFFNVDEYYNATGNTYDAVYSSGTAITTSTVHLGGSGKILQFGIEADIYGQPLSIQQMTVYLKMGRLI